MREQRRSSILVVDDNLINLEVISRLVQDFFDSSVLTASSGAEAMKLLGYTLPDLVLLDVTMPGMNGYEVCAAMRADPQLAEIPVIFLTGQRDPRLIIKGFETGGTDYLLKPFEPRELMARVRIQLEHKLQRDELRQRNSELEAALARIRRLEGIMPICMYCKKIRTDSSSWQEVEQYIAENSDACFSHGVCPSCFKEQCGKIAAMPDE